MTVMGFMDRYHVPEWDAYRAYVADTASSVDAPRLRQLFGAWVSAVGMEDQEAAKSCILGFVIEAAEVYWDAGTLGNLRITQEPPLTGDERLDRPGTIMLACTQAVMAAARTGPDGAARAMELLMAAIDPASAADVHAGVQAAIGVYRAALADPTGQNPPPITVTPLHIHRARWN